MIGKIIAAMVAGYPDELIISRLGVTQEEIDSGRSAIVADTDSTQEDNLGVAIRRVENIYKDASAAEEFSVALAAQKELSKLQDLYSMEIKKENVVDETETVLSKIVAHLDTLPGLPDNVPIFERVRVVVEMARRATL